MISPAQIRSARAHLNLSQDEVAEAAGITKYTLSNIERGATEASSKSLEVLQAFFERRGLVFTPDDGVKMVKGDVRAYEGAAGFREFIDDVYNTLKEKPGTYCVSNVDENNWLKWTGPEQSRMLCDRLASIKGIRAHILIKEGDDFTFAHHAEYRTIPADLFYDNTSFYVYGDKLALIHFETNNVTVRVLQNRYFSESFKLMFYRFWDKLSSPVHAQSPEIEMRAYA